MIFIGNLKCKKKFYFVFIFRKKNIVLRCEVIKSKKFADIIDKDLIVWVG